MSCAHCKLTGNACLSPHMPCACLPVRIIAFGANLGPFTQGVDLPNKRAAKRAYKKSRFGRPAFLECPLGRSFGTEACATGSVAAKSVDAALPPQVMPALCLRIASSQAMLACLAYVSKHACLLASMHHCLWCCHGAYTILLCCCLYNVIVCRFEQLSSPIQTCCGIYYSFLTSVCPLADSNL